jgi:hypothetical protein
MLVVEREKVWQAVVVSDLRNVGVAGVLDVNICCIVKSRVS